MVLDKCMAKSDIQMVQSHFSKIQKDSDCELTEAKEFMRSYFGWVHSGIKVTFGCQNVRPISYRPTGSIPFYVKLLHQENDTSHIHHFRRKLELYAELRKPSPFNDVHKSDLRMYQLVYFWSFRDHKSCYVYDIAFSILPTTFFDM